MAKRRRTEIALIADPAARLVTYSKRRKGLFNKASELCRLCGARAAVVVFSPAGKPYSFGDPSADDIISDYLRVGDGDGDVVPPMDLTECEKWVEAELDAYTTEEELEHFISKYEAVRDCLRQKLESLEEEEEEDSQVKVGGAADSQVLTEQQIDAIFESLARCPALPDLTDGDHDGVMTSPENSAAAGGSSAVESNPARPDLQGCAANAAGGASLGMASTPTSSDLEDCGFDPDELLTLLADGDGFLNSPEDSAAGGGYPGAEAAPLSDQEEGHEYYNPNDFVDLEDLDVQL